MFLNSVKRTPACAKLSLYLSKSYSNKLEDIVPAQELQEVDENGKPKSAVELLIQRIQAIQKELPRREPFLSPEEKAFTEAAQEQYRLMRQMLTHPSRKGGTHQ